MNQISKILTYIIFAIIILMMIIGLLMKNDFFDILMLSISLAVAAIPEGFATTHKNGIQIKKRYVVLVAI